MWKKLLGFLNGLKQEKVEISPIPNYEYRPIRWEQLTLDLEFEKKKKEN